MCALSNTGGYVHANKAYKVHVNVFVEGRCQTRVTPYPECPHGAYWNRGAGTTNLMDSARTPTGFGFVAPTAPPLPQTYQTNPPQNTASSGVTWNATVGGVTVEGMHIIQSDTGTSQTACNFTPVSFPASVPLTVFATNCVPKWQRNSSGQLVHLVGNPTLPTQVYVPSTMNARMQEGIAAAVKAWNTALQGVSGAPSLVVTSTECSGPFCVKTQEENFSTGDHCAAAVAATDPTTGQVTNATITFPTQSMGWSVGFNARIAGHELGHLMGLGDNESSCPPLSTFMRPVTCGTTSGFPVDVQPSDGLPVTNSTYGQTPTNTCPSG